MRPQFLWPAHPHVVSPDKTAAARSVLRLPTPLAAACLIVDPKSRARAPRKLGMGIGDDMLRFNVSVATTLPHRGALDTWFRLPAEQQPEYRSECWGVAASEVPASRRDDGRLDVEARCVDEHISALRTVHPCPDHRLACTSRATVWHQPVRS
jgi:hypothetical protein